MDSLEGLNSSQRDAVITVSGPLLLLAGAGSGKTKTLTHRIAHLIADEGIWPEEILAVTFTNKAAREMRERLGELLARDATSREFMPYMGTFHGICVRLLRINGQAINIEPNFVIYDEDDRRRLIKQAMKDLTLSDQKIKPAAVSGLISSAKNQLVDPDEYEASANYPFQRDVAAIYRAYESLRKQARALDFDDLLLETVRLLQTADQVRQKWRRKFKHILIDEYQDTNAAQYKIVNLLINDQKNICVVGDDWQSIYSWRGADFTNILNFEKDFPDAKIVKLEQNYRSTSPILEAAHSVISKNTERTDKKLWTDRKGGEPVSVSQASDEQDEAAKIASQISSQVALGLRSYQDFAVLYRTNALSYALEQALRRFRVPYQVVGGMRFYDRAEIKDTLAYLKVLYQPQDRLSFSRIVNVPARGIGETSLLRFLAWQSASGLDIITALNRAQEATGLTTRAKNSLLKVGELFTSLGQDIESADPATLIEQIVDASGYRDMLLADPVKGAERLENIGSLISEASVYASISDFLEEVSLASSVDESNEGGEVTLMTLHAAKGLEFPVVHMIGLEEGLFPHARVYDEGPRELEEERRLCYVGMTRAREELHISYATSRLQFGSRQYNQPSRFLKDMGHSVVEFGASSFGYEGEARPIGAPAEPEFFADMPDFDIGDRVKSQQFGEGEIIDVDGLAVTVQLANGTTKKLNVEYARLRKLTA